MADYNASPVNTYVGVVPPATGQADPQPSEQVGDATYLDHVPPSTGQQRGKIAPAPKQPGLVDGVTLTGQAMRPGGTSGDVEMNTGSARVRQAGGAQFKTPGPGQADRGSKGPGRIPQAGGARYNPQATPRGPNGRPGGTSARARGK